MTSADEPAFPEIHSDGIERGRISPIAEVWSSGGLTKRELFAAMAMQSLIAKSPYGKHDIGAIPERIREIVGGACDYADALLKELEGK